MKVTGVTFIRNAVKFDYPVIESIQSLLPMVDELIVVLGASEDGTELLMQKIISPKLKFIKSTWDDSVREGGRVLAIETNKGLDHVSSDTDWIFYLQADEVLHEKDYEEIKIAMLENINKPEVQGLLFKYFHFYGHYRYLGNSRRWYNHEVRIIRNLKGIRSFKDAQGFRLNDQKLNVIRINASIYHYGWVKNPIHQQEKQKNFNLYWHNPDEVKKMIQNADEYDYSVIDSLTVFEQDHPSCMKERIQKANWEFTFDVSKKRLKLKEKVVSFFEVLFNRELFRYKNYYEL